MLRDGGPVKLSLLEVAAPGVASMAPALRRRGHDVLTIERAEADDVVLGFDCIVVAADPAGGAHDGLAVAEALCWRGEDAVMVVAAEQDLRHRLLAHRRGVDDYIALPVLLLELETRLVRALRRLPRPAVLRSGPLVLDTGRRAVHVSGAAVSLRPREFDVLVHLLRHRGEVVTRADLFDAVWGDHYTGLSNVVDVHIRNIRRALAPLRADGMILTERGVGYRLVPLGVSPAPAPS